MSGETGDVTSGWTVDTLHQHVQRQIDDMYRLLNERHEAQQSAIQAALLSAEKAVAKAEGSTEKRFESVNEFRAQLADQTNGFLPREVADAQFAELRKHLTALAARLDRSEGGSVERRQTMQGLSTQAQLVLGVVAVIVTVLVANGVFS